MEENIVRARKRTLKYVRTKKGVVTKIYSGQSRSSKVRGDLSQNYSKEEFKGWLFSQKNWDGLYNNWVESGYQKDLKPSVDRKDDYLPYTLNNIQLMTWKENRMKYYRDAKNGKNNKQNKVVIQYDLDGNAIKEYYSASQASRELGINVSHIGEVCRGGRKTSGGFKWKYKSY